MGRWEWAHAALGGAATVIFLFQTFCSMSGDADAGYDADAGAGVTDADSEGGFIAYLSVRNLVALFIGYGWVTLAALLSGASREAASLMGICAGLVLVFISLHLIRTFLNLQEDGSLNLDSLAGKRASVYITVGGAASGTGKVLVDTKAGRTELPARTDDPEPIRPGSIAKILRAEDGVLWVTLGA